MNFCPKCGAKLNTDSKFCAECGTKIENTSSNKIDNSIDKVLKNIDNISKEVENSDYVNKTINASKNSFNYIKELLIKTFAYLGIIIFIVQFFNYIFSESNIHYISAYQELFDSYYYKNKFERAIIYLAQILPSTIIPIVFIYLYSKRAEWMNYVLGIIFMGLIITGLNSKSKDEINLDNSTEIENNYESSSEQVDKNLNSDSLIEKPENNNSVNEDVKYKNLEDDFTFNSIKYSYKFKCLFDVWGNTDLKVYKNGKLFFESSYSPFNCEIFNINKTGNYFCFEIHSVGGTNGLEYYTYYLLDLRNADLYELEKNYPVDEDKNYTLYGVEKIKENTEVYNILKSKIKI